MKRVWLMVFGGWIALVWLSWTVAIWCDNLVVKP